jgi:hypothetical protein
MTLTEKIRLIQIEEGNDPCFNTIKRRGCPQDCCWKEACHEYKVHLLEVKPTSKRSTDNLSAGERAKAIVASWPSWKRNIGHKL